MSSSTGYPGNDLSVGCTFHFLARCVCMIEHSLTVFYPHPVNSRNIFCLAQTLGCKIFGWHPVCDHIKALNKMLWVETVLAHLQGSGKSAWLPEDKANDAVTGFICWGQNLWSSVLQLPFTFLQLSLPIFLLELLWQSLSMMCQVWGKLIY